MQVIYHHNCWFENLYPRNITGAFQAGPRSVFHTTCSQLHATNYNLRNDKNMKVTARLVALLLLFTSCSLESSNPEEVEMPSEPTHQLRSIFKISELDNQHFISYITDIEFLSNGNIIMHNGRNSKHLLELDPNRELQNTIGRSGRGPGEFVTIDRFAVTPDDTLHVFDGDNKKHQVFAKSEAGEWELSRIIQLEVDSEKKFVLDFPLEVYESTENTYHVRYQNRPLFRIPPPVYTPPLQKQIIT